MRTAFRKKSARISVCVVVLVGLMSLPTTAQEEPAPTLAVDIAASELEARIKAAQESTTLDEAVKAQIVSLYNDALTAVNQRDASFLKAEEFRQTREAAPESLRLIQEELAQPIPEVDLTSEIGSDETAADLDIRLSAAENQLAEERAKLAELEKEPARRTDQRKLIPKAQADLRQRLDALQSQLSALSNSAEPQEIIDARGTLLNAQIQAAQQELRALTEELQSYDSRGRLLTARLDQTTRNIAKAEKAAAAWRQLVSERRNAEALRAAEASREALFEANDAPVSIRELVRRLARENVDLATARTGRDGILRRIEQAERDLERVAARLTSLESDFTSVQNRVEAAGNSGAIGLLLRNQRSELPEAADLRRNIRLREQTISAAQLEQYQREDERRALADVEAVVDAQLEALAPGADGEQREKLAQLLRETYRVQRDGLDALLGDIATYFEKLVDLDSKELQLIDASAEFRNYINEHILWIQSGSVVGPRDFGNLVSTVVWLVQPTNLLQIPKALWQDYASRPVPLTLVYAFPIALLFAGRVIRKRVLDLGDRAAKRRCTNITFTLSATFLVVLRSIGPPLLLATIGWRLSSSLYSDEFARTTGQGLMTAAIAFWSIYLPRLVMRPGSLADKHFGWPKEPLKRMSLYLSTFMPVAVILVFVIVLLESDGELERQESAGRMAFVCLMICVGILCNRLLKSRGGALLDAFDMWRGRSRLGTRRFWYAVGIITPVLLTIAAGSGYYYSALRLASRLYLTAFGAFLLLLMAALALRWSLLARRRIAIEQAKRRLEALKAEAVEGEKPPEEPELDLAKVDSQTGRLVRSTFLLGLLVSMWFIWAEFLPALSVLNDAEVWKTTVQTTTQEELPSGEVETQNKLVVIPITARDLVVAFLIGIATFIAVQNIPGLFEFAVLQRLPMVAGERYAVKTIFGYGLVLIGFLWAVNTIGVGWSQVQWLVAAVGLGLGFGLQEIFANFIAGLIILFEQPIRVGDTVTVGDTSGKVSKIRIRATWITAFNRQELIVPNKEFVTGRLINWTLSDQVLRIEVLVGIAYGSDTKKARQLLTKIAQSNELVMKDPAPEVYFFGFGDNSLQFELRVYSPNMESYLKIKDEMHQQVDDAFRKAGIEIAFPQRDIHIRNINDVLRIEKPDPSTES